VDGVTEDDLFQVWIPTARRFFEQATGMTLHEKTYEAVYESFPVSRVLTLPMATPLIEVQSVKYVDYQGTETTIDEEDYVVDTYSSVGRVMPGYDLSWPSFTPYPVYPVRVTYRAGIATTSPEAVVKPDIQHCVAMLTGHFHKHREAVLTNDRGIVYQSQAVEIAARSIITQHIVWSFS
jgi:uncharacterized phiE125 gp8 family phage protein